MAEQVPRLATANTSTTCCCEHVGNTAAAHITHMNNPPQSRRHGTQYNTSQYMHAAEYKCRARCLRNSTSLGSFGYVHVPNHKCSNNYRNVAPLCLDIKPLPPPHPAPSAHFFIGEQRNSIYIENFEKIPSGRSH